MYATARALKVEVGYKAVGYVRVPVEQGHHKDFLLLKERVQHVEVLDR